MNIVMRQPCLAVLAVLSFFLSAATAQEIAKPAVQKVDGKISWVYDYENGKALSAESGKPMFVVFRCER